MNPSAPISPPDDDLARAVRDLREKNPTLGAAKLLQSVLSQERDPPWTVSEKRLRKILQKEGLVAGATSAGQSTNSLSTHETSFPTSHILSHLDVEKWTKKVDVKDFGKIKGKGLVAKEPITAGDHIWIEDPIVMSAEQ